MQQVYTEKAYASASPLSQAVDCDDYVFVSGSAGFDPETDELVGDSFEAQLEMTFENIETVLAAADLEMDDVVKVNAFLVDADDFEQFNEIYRTVFSSPYPARSTVVTDLVFDGKVEVDVIAKR